jgi:hypothetical protein
MSAGWDGPQNLLGTVGQLVAFSWYGEQKGDPVRASSQEREPLGRTSDYFVIDRLIDRPEIADVRTVCRVRASAEIPPSLSRQTDQPGVSGVGL